jgi:hypothetical protein
MVATLQQFSRALLSPALALATLANARTIADRNGIPRLMRTTRFAEAEIEWQGSHWLVAMPLTNAALPHIERMVSAIKKLNTDYLTEFRILPHEMCLTDEWSGAEYSIDLVLHRLPSTVGFAEAVLIEPKENLLAALDSLQEEMSKLKFTHNNLHESNLRWVGSRFIPIRYYDAQIGDKSDSDIAAFDELRNKIICTQPSPMKQTLHDITMPYHAISRLTGHRWTSHVFEGLVCVEDDNGFGFVDTDNNPVIAAQFIWAGDFHEGRAEVQASTGMGLIDRQGCYVIPPEYEIIDYDHIASVVHVRQGGKWALFDYLGRQMTKFNDKL